MDISFLRIDCAEKLEVFNRVMGKILPQCPDLALFSLDVDHHFNNYTSRTGSNETPRSIILDFKSSSSITGIEIHSSYRSKYYYIDSTLYHGYFFDKSETEPMTPMDSIAPDQFYTTICLSQTGVLNRKFLI